MGNLNIKINSSVIASSGTEAPKFTVFTDRNLGKIPQFQQLPKALQHDIQVAASVFPFRVNNYVLEQLIDWDDPCADPIFRLVFPQREMLSKEDFSRLSTLIESGVDRQEVAAVVADIRSGLNPHPAGQMELNVPENGGEKIEGIQHKYRETVLFFPSQGQTCHSYCTFCFRWAQFIGDTDLRFAAKEAEGLINHLRANPSITDVLFTGGDPMVMKAKNLQAYIEPLLEPEFDHIRTIRIGTKSLTFWPYRYVTDADAEEVLALFRRVTAAGKHLAFMAHFNHWRELDTDICCEAIARIRETGAVIRTQAPLLKHINDDPKIWAKMWRMQVNLGLVPYYMFVERDTGARHYFEVPLVKAWSIYRDAIQQVSGIARTVRGPSMSADPGKIEIHGVTEIYGEKVLALRFIQGRNSDWVQRPFFAKYDEQATWLDHLQPAFDDKFFYQDEFEQMKNGPINQPVK